MKKFSYTPIRARDLSASDLQDEAVDRPDAQLYSITIYDGTGTKPDAERAQAMYLPDERRLGISWGAEATWADVDDLESGIEMWLNDGEAWAAAN